MFYFIFHVLFHRDKDCQKIQEVFLKSFLSKDPCDATEQDYQPLIELANQTVPCNKVTGASFRF